MQIDSFLAKSMEEREVPQSQAEAKEGTGPQLGVSVSCMSASFFASLSPGNWSVVSGKQTAQ